MRKGNYTTPELVAIGIPTDIINYIADLKEKNETLQLESEKQKNSSSMWCKKAMDKHNEIRVYKNGVEYWKKQFIKVVGYWVNREKPNFIYKNDFLSDANKGYNRILSELEKKV